MLLALITLSLSLIILNTILHQFPQVFILYCCRNSLSVIDLLVDFVFCAVCAFLDVDVELQVMREVPKNLNSGESGIIVALIALYVFWVI